MKDFKKYYILSAEPEEVYNALTNPATLQLWTGEKAEMSTEPDPSFLSGTIALWVKISLEPARKIVQEWYFGDQAEPSIVTIILHPHKQGTSVELRHTNIPDQDFEDIIEGWDSSYFGALQDFYED